MSRTRRTAVAVLAALLLGASGTAITTSATGNVLAVVSCCR
jgi:hypothetical protein